MKATIPILIGLLLFNAPLWGAVPEESIWTSFLCAGTFFAAIGARMLARREGDKPNNTPQAFGSPYLAVDILLAICCLSVLARVIRQHGAPAYIGPMLQACVVLTVYALIFRQAAWFGRRSGTALYGLTLAIVAGATVASCYGIQEFLFHWQAGEKSWRVFGTSTPDFFAGYLVMTAPLTVALFLGAKRNGISILYGLSALLQLVSIVTAQSRFALVSLAAAGIVIVIALIAASRSGLSIPAATRMRATAILIMVVLGGIALGGPVLHRLQNPEKNSTEFRIWTWKGTIAMVRDHFTVGTGFGTYLYDYPKYALTGFTRLAHNSYLQVYAECGILGGLALVVCLWVFLVSAWRGLRVANITEGHPLSLSPSPGELHKDVEINENADLHEASEVHENVEAPDVSVAREQRFRGQLHGLVNAVAMAENRFLGAGLLAGLVAGLVQNTIDSDWYIFAIGFTFSALAGLAVALSPGLPDGSFRLQAALPRLPYPIAIGGLAGLLALCVSNGLAAAMASGARVGLASPSPQAAESAKSALLTAHRLAPWNGKYVGDLGYAVYLQRMNDPKTAVTYLRRAIALQPDSPTLKRLGLALIQSGDPEGAIAAYKAGLQKDPNSLDLLLGASAICPPTEAMGYYIRMTQVEDSPVGQVRALGEIVEEKFAKADAAVADLAVVQGDTQKAIEYFFRAEAVIEKYADEGGSTNTMRMGISGGRANASEEKSISALYDHTLSELFTLVPSDQQRSLVDRHRIYAEKLKQLFTSANQPGT